MADPLFISFATADSGYEAELRKLTASLDHLGLESHTESIPSRGSWQANSGYRPTWIRRVLDLRGRPVVWIDADGIVRRHPKAFFEEGDDFRAYFHPDGRAAGGTLYFAPTEAARRLLAVWERRVSAPFAEWPESHQRLTELHLKDALAEVGDELRVGRLSEAYCRIFDWGEHPDPVVEHFQASRRLRTEVGDARDGLGRGRSTSG